MLPQKKLALFIMFACHLLLVHTVSAASITSTTTEVAPNQSISHHSVIRLPNIHPGRDPIYAYAKTLLYKALQATEAQYGTFELLVDNEIMPQERQLQSLEHNLLDVTWSVTSVDREKLHLAVRIPLMAGLFGKRLMLVRGDDERFNTPLSLENLKSYRMVQGYDWPDTRIFRHNKIHVLETTYQASFRIVMERFADMFPRSVLEIQNELDNLSDKSALKIAPNILISYDSPLFFFVSLQRPELANRIAQGLLILLENGEFQQILSQQRVYQQSLILMKGRTEIELENPLLSQQSKQALEKYLSYFN